MLANMYVYSAKRNQVIWDMVIIKEGVRQGQNTIKLVSIGFELRIFKLDKSHYQWRYNLLSKKCE